MSSIRPRRVLLLGWDAADWKVINPLIDAGKMPTLARLVEEGAIGDLATLDPPVSPMLWTTIATGRTADEHGVLSFHEVVPEEQTARPVLSTTRKVRALWNMLTLHDRPSVVAGWWPSHPAEPIRGAMVSNFVQHATAGLDDPWPFPEGAVHPPELAERMAELRVHPFEMTAAHLAPFVPKLAEGDPPAWAHRALGGVAKILAHAATVQACATELMEHQEWDLAAVYFDAIDHFCHGYMKFHPPANPRFPAVFADWFGGVVEAAYRFHDMMLERLIQLAGPETLVVLVSDHGFHSDHLRPRGIPRQNPAGPMIEHRHHGVVCLHGPGVAPDALIYGADLLDIAPTVLAALGLPIGNDMPGRVLTDAFVEPMPVETIESWDLVEGEDGRHDGHVATDAVAEWAAHQQLVELGYAEPAEGDQQERMVKVMAEIRYFLSRVKIDRGRIEEAIEVLEPLVEEFEEIPRYRRALMRAYFRAERFTELRSRLEELDAEAEGPGVVRDVFWGWVHLAEGEPEAAVLRLEQAEAARPGARWILRSLARAHLAAGGADRARRILDQLLLRDPHDASALELRAHAATEMEDRGAAIDDLLASLALRFDNPDGHAALGRVLLLEGDLDRAEHAARVATRQGPNRRSGHELALDLYTNHRPDEERASRHAAALSAIEQSARSA